MARTVLMRARHDDSHRMLAMQRDSLPVRRLWDSVSANLGHLSCFLLPRGAAGLSVRSRRCGWGILSRRGHALSHLGTPTRLARRAHADRRWMATALLRSLCARNAGGCGEGVSMSRECVFCGNVTGWCDVGAMIVIGDADQPLAGLVCRRCAALPTDEQARRREAAMDRARARPAERHRN